jgi:3-deoxy-D-manno-octulosonic acid (KDO) 8-phosphate synthase
MDRLTVCACHLNRSMDLTTGQFLVPRQIETVGMKVDSRRYIKLSVVGERGDESQTA